MVTKYLTVAIVGRGEGGGGRGLIWTSMAIVTCLAINILQNILCVQQKKETHTSLEQLVGESIMSEFSFLGEISI